MKAKAALTVILLAAAGRLAAQTVLEQAPEKAYVFLRGEARVSGAQLLLGEVAQVSGFDEQLIAQLENLPLGPAPMPGNSLTVSKDDIRRSLAGHRIDPLNVAFAGLDAITVTRPGRIVTHEEIKGLVDDYVRSGWSGEDARTEVIYTRLPDEMALEGDDFSLTVLDPVKHDLSGALAVSVAATEEERVLARFPVSVKVRVWRNVAVANNSLNRGEVLSAEDISFEERELTGRHDEFVYRVDDAVGMRLRRPVKNGQALTSSHLESLPLIERGDEIILIVKYKGITIGCPGKAWQKGGKGDRILVRNQYGKNLVGEVQDSQTVLITP